MPEHAWDAHPWRWDEPSHVADKAQSVPCPGGSSVPGPSATNLADVREVSVPQTAVAAAAESHDDPPVWEGRTKWC